MSVWVSKYSHCPYILRYWSCTLNEGWHGLQEKKFKQPGQPLDISVTEVGVVIKEKWCHVFWECYDKAAENRYNHERKAPRGKRWQDLNVTLGETRELWLQVDKPGVFRSKHQKSSKIIIPSPHPTFYTQYFSSCLKSVQCLLADSDEVCDNLAELMFPYCDRKLMLPYYDRKLSDMLWVSVFLDSVHEFNNSCTGGTNGVPVQPCRCSCDIVVFCTASTKGLYIAFPFS